MLHFWPQKRNATMDSVLKKVMVTEWAVFLCSASMLEMLCSAVCEVYEVQHESTLVVYNGELEPPLQNTVRTCYSVGSGVDTAP